MPGPSTSIYITTSFESERVQDSVIALKYIDTEEMIADILMKPLPKHRFEKLVAKLDKKTVK